MPLIPVMAACTDMVIAWNVAKADAIATALPAPATREAVRTPRARTRYSAGTEVPTAARSVVVMMSA